MLQARRRLAALLLLVHTTCAGRIVLSVDASSQEKTTVATVLDGGRPLGGSASAYYKDFWGRLSDACNRALADSGCTPSDVGAIEFISPAQDAAEPLLTTSKREVIVEPTAVSRQAAAFRPLDHRPWPQFVRRRPHCSSTSTSTRRTRRSTLPRWRRPARIASPSRLR